MIYIVDDDPSVRRAIVRLLKAAGMSAQAFASGNDFLACERSGDNNCVILDVHMPGMGGLELAKMRSTIVRHLMSQAKRWAHLLPPTISARLLP